MNRLAQAYEASGGRGALKRSALMQVHPRCTGGEPDRPRCTNTRTDDSSDERLLGAWFCHDHQDQGLAWAIVNWPSNAKY